MKSDALNGMDSLLATVQMPAGIPVGTLAIGKPGAVNAALFAVAILANSRPELRKKLKQFREKQEQQIREISLD
jgi:5-(carboxyamino)imidazole ribonucleotide mutase